MAVNSVSDDPIVSYDCGALKLCRDDQGALNIKNGTCRCGCRLGSSICGLLSDGNGCLQIARLDRGSFLSREPEPLRRASEDPSENEDTYSGDGYSKFKRVRRSGVPKGTNGVGYIFLMPAREMMSANIGTSRAMRAMCSLPRVAVTSNPDSVSFARMSGRRRMPSATCSRRATTSGGVFAGAISAV